MSRLTERVYPVFRNDDVSADTEVESFRAFCALFDRYGFRQLHGVTIWGPVANPTGQNTLFARGKRGIIEHCNRHIESNPEIIESLNGRDDELAAHGYHHICYAYEGYDAQMTELEKTLEVMARLFPRKEVRVFIPPFNATNEHTRRACERLGLEINDATGSILLENAGVARPHWLGKTLRYHYWKYGTKVPCAALTEQLEAIHEFLRASENGDE